MRLLIVESPAKAKTIEKYLDKAYTVKASVGHIRDLPKSNKNAIDIANGFKPHYQISPGKEKVVNDLKKIASRAEEVVLATDPDREGEAIAWHLQEAIGLKKAKRIVFHEITEAAVKEAIKHPRDIDDNLKQAQEARRVLDRLFGYDLSALIWTKLRYGLSAGRVQSPALRLLVEREKEIRAFIPEQYWIINACLETINKEKINFISSLEPKTAAEAEAIVTAAKKSDWQIKKVTESEAKRRPRAPFTTSTLQQAASSRLGLSPSNTMRLAQRLYEAGHITYMRTDSTNWSPVAFKQIEQVVKKTFGDKYHTQQIYSSKAKNAQEAHEAIRPTNFTQTIAGTSEAEKKVYQLIWQRSVSSQMASAQMAKTKIIAASDNKLVPEFSAHGSRITFDGWLKADPRSRGEETEVPKVTSGDKLKLITIESTGKETEPPHRYSEAGLIKELEKRGIGRPSTYAPTLKTIIDRGYAIKEGRTLLPTDTGEVVSDFLSEHFSHYISDSFTAELENDLDEIARGKRDYVKTLKNFYTPFTKEIKAKKDIPKINTLAEAPDDIKCPICAGQMVVKLSKNGRFYSCKKFPDCAGALTSEGKVLEPPKETGEDCPDCTKGKLIIREGRFGKFTSCNRYPKCKYIKNDPASEEQNSTGVTCPACQKGKMAEKKGRFGIFYGCTNYPNCKNIIKAKPTGDLCKECGSLMMAGTKTIPERCSQKTCPNHNPHKNKK